MCVCVCVVGKGVLYLFIHEWHFLKGTRCTVCPAECEETCIAALYM